MQDPSALKAPLPERLSIELTNYCTKGCPFCYNTSSKTGQTHWNNTELIAFVKDCAANGVRAVSFGGGEPLEYDGVFELLETLKGTVFRSLTTHGLGLSGETEDRLLAASPDKVHISIHFPHIDREVSRVRDQVVHLTERGLRCGVNLLVEKNRLSEAKNAATRLKRAGIGLDRIIFLPRRSVKDPALVTTPHDLLEAAGEPRFQSMTCLKACAKSPRFCAVSWDKEVAWCSYTSARRKLEILDANGLRRALDGLGLVHCGSLARGNFI
jgi:molybdenum cofactor biosynthesis enzyme MoaA